MFLCPTCGGGLRFSPEKQKLVCDYCDSEFTTKEYNDKKTMNAQEQDESYYAATLFTCPQCGGELLTQDDTAATFCSFCGSSVMLESRIVEQMKPDFVIPFKVTKEECEQAYKKYIAKAKYVPKDMKDGAHVSQFRGIYMPYWTYSFKAKPFKATDVSSTRKGDYVYKDYYDVDVNCHASMEGITYDASSTFADDLSGSIAPYDFSEKQPFHPAFLSGFYADTNDVAADVYSNSALKTVRAELANAIVNDKNADKRLGEGEVENYEKVSPEKPQLAFMPVWFLATKNRDGSRVSYAVVNGQTGKITADLPIDFRKYLISSLIIAIPLFLLLNLALTLTPNMAVMVSMALALFATVVALGDSAKVKAREKGTDDRGYAAVNKEKIRQEELAEKKAEKEAQKLPKSMRPKKKKDWNAVRPMIGFILGGTIIFGNPPNDSLFYITSALISFLVAWTFFSIVQHSNMLTTRKPPQLAKRGGEEHV